MWKMAIGRNNNPAAKILVAPICQPVRCSLLFFIRINELPQTSASPMKSAQLVKFCFAMEAAKVRKFTFDT